jgi:hypothetical protein
MTHETDRGRVPRAVVTFGHLWSALRGWARRVLPHRYRPRFIRRTHVVCPETGEAVQIDVELAVQPEQRRVLQCSRHPGQDPTCSEACLHDPRIWEGPADALLIVPPGHGVPAERD